MDLRETILSCAEEKKAQWQKIALAIHAKPEVSNHEFFACDTLSAALEAEGFLVTRDVAGHRTGFTAVYRAEKDGPVIVFPAEYDALAGLGHGCGHNLFGAISSLAGICLKQVIDQTGGEVRVYGTPGEEGGENGSAKGSFVREGFLKDVDAALCLHPTTAGHKTTAVSLGCAPVDIEFRGRAAHAAAAPEKGINALDALILTYNGINALRQHVTDDVRIHGIITDGGDAPNTVPDYAKAKFYIRAASMPVLNDVYRKVENIVQGAAAMTGATGSMKPYQNIVENTVPTPKLDEVFIEEMLTLGETVRWASPSDSLGSTDAGNFSQVVPTLHANISIDERKLAGHSPEFLRASCAQKGLDAIPLGAKALALTALRLITDPGLLSAVKKDHERAVAEQ